MWGVKQCTFFIYLLILRKFLTKISIQRQNLNLIVTEMTSLELPREFF